VTFLSWIAPPLVGALLGLLVAWLAGRALFRVVLPRTLDRPLASAATLFPSGISAWLEPALKTLLSRIFSSRDFIYAVRDLVSRAVGSISSMKVRDVAGRFDLEGLFTGRLLPQLSRDRESIARSVAAGLGSDGGTVLSEEFLDSLPLLMEPLLPSAAGRIVQWLKSAETRATLSLRGRELLPRILEKLNAVQRLLLSAGQFDTRLDEKMPEIIDDTTATLEKIVKDPREQRRLLWLLVDIVRDWRSAGGAETVVASLVAQVLKGLDDPKTSKRLYGLIEARLLAGEPTLGRLARQSLGVQDSDAAELLSAQILTWLSKEETVSLLARQAGALASRLVAESGATSVAAILPADMDVPKRLREALSPWVLVCGAGIGLCAGLAQLLLRALGLFRR
jgi:hypothetical protein